MTCREGAPHLGASSLVRSPRSPGNRAIPCAAVGWIAEWADASPAKVDAKRINQNLVWSTRSEVTAIGTPAEGTGHRERSLDCVLARGPDGGPHPPIGLPLTLTPLPPHRGFERFRNALEQAPIGLEGLCAVVEHGGLTPESFLPSNRLSREIARHLNDRCDASSSANKLVSLACTASPRPGAARVSLASRKLHCQSLARRILRHKKKSKANL